MHGNANSGAGSFSAPPQNKYHHYQHRSENKATFEAHAYEALLITVKAWETQLFEALDESIQDVLAYFKKG